MPTMKTIVEDKKRVRNVVNTNLTTIQMNVNFRTNIQTDEMTIWSFQDLMNVGDKKKKMVR